MRQCPDTKDLAVVNKTIHDVIGYSTYEERLNFLRTHSKVGFDTFGYDRYFNQQFYHSREWRRIRDTVIVRDNGCDLGCPDRPIHGQIYIHHMNPITVEQLRNDPSQALNPECLICCSFETHQAIHYGTEPVAPLTVLDRQPNDTCPWKL